MKDYEGYRQKIVEHALAAFWNDIREGGTSGHDKLDEAIMAYQVATGVAEEGE